MAMLKIYVYPEDLPPFSNDPSSKENLNYDSLFHPETEPVCFEFCDSPDEADFITSSFRYSDFFTHLIRNKEGFNKILEILPLINDPKYQHKHFFVSAHCYFPIN